MHNPSTLFPSHSFAIIQFHKPSPCWERRRLFRVTLNLLFQSRILALCKKFSSCSSSDFTTQSLAWCNHRIPGCLLSGPNDTTVVDYQCTETIPMGPSTKFHYLFCFLFCSFAFWKSGNETELITPGSENVLCGCWIVLNFPYAMVNICV